MEALGFEAKLLCSGDASSLRLQLGGMTCSSCSTAIEESLRATPGVAKASVSLITSTAEVRAPSSVYAACLAGCDCATFSVHSTGDCEHSAGVNISLQVVPQGP